VTKCRLAVIGASWGGFEAVASLLAALDADLDLAVVVAQHRGPDMAEGILTRWLQARCPLPVAEVDDKDDIVAGHVYVAPPDYHLLVDDGYFSLSVDDAVRFSRPSIDVLFESAAETYGDAVVAIVLTGANDDGCRGVLAVKDAGGVVYVQDPTTAERSEMPEAAIGTGVVDRVLPLPAIAAVLNELGRREARDEVTADE
jgi:two-component system, chemotaxis family, protein-glutamate methylesterase/glutaminase